MKKLVCLILCVLALLLCFGCTADEAEPQGGISFYYPMTELSFQPDSSCFASERRQVDSISWVQTLNIYIAGPESEQMRSPFPAALLIKQVTVEDNTVHLTVSNHLASLTGLDLTLACSCLCMTATELTGTEEAVISAEDALLDGQKSISMSKNNILLANAWQED